MHRYRVPFTVAAIVGVAVLSGALIAGQGADADEPTSTRLPDGVHVGRITAASAAPDELAFRPVELLFGVEARTAAAADGVEAFDYYVRDDHGTPVEVTVDPDVAVTTVDCSANCVEGNPSEYEALTHADALTLYRLTVEDGAAVAVDAIYLP